jgi:glycerol-3-phosphate acyltransferase PlsY
MGDVAEVVVALVAGYLIGTFPSADIVTRLVTRGHVDLRASGSGNPGGLNAARVLGKKWGLLVIVLDALKGAVAGFVGLAVGDAAAYAAATAAIAGHCWPVWNGFRGGKGVAAAGGSYFAVFPPMVAVNGLVTLLVAAVTRRSGLAIRTALVVWVLGAALWWAADLPNWWGPEPSAGMLLAAVVGSAMILVRFRAAARAGGSSL